MTSKLLQMITSVMPFFYKKLSKKIYCRIYSLFCDKKKVVKTMASPRWSLAKVLKSWGNVLLPPHPPKKQKWLKWCNFRKKNFFWSWKIGFFYKKICQKNMLAIWVQNILRLFSAAISLCATLQIFWRQKCWKFYVRFGHFGRSVGQIGHFLSRSKNFRQKVEVNNLAGNGRFYQILLKNVLFGVLKSNVVYIGSLYHFYKFW